MPAVSPKRPTSTHRPTAHRTAAQLVGRLVPVVFEDDHYVALNKPPRIDLTAPLTRRGPRLVDVLLALRAGAPSPLQSAPAGTTPAPVILPEKNASGVALFAKTEQAVEQLATEAAAGRLHYQHVLVVKGRIRNRRFTVRPAQVRANRTRAGDASVPLAGRFDVIRPDRSLNIVRCHTRAATLSELRCIVRAAELDIVGDAERTARLHPDRARRSRRLMTHLETVAFQHTLGRRTLEITAPTPRSFTEYQSTNHTPQEHLHVALVRRLMCLLDDQTDCYRLLTAQEGLAGLTADRYANVVVLETLAGRFHGDEQLLRQVANWYHRMLDIDTVIARPARQRATAQANPPVLTLHGDPIERIVVRESGVRFEVTPAAAGLTGLFADHRENRSRVRAMSSGRDVLNLFAYTSAFSVSAALGEARSTTSVDLSAKHLEWARRNFEINGISLDNHWFIRSEVFAFFARARRQKRRYDIIIIDPPTFARSKKPRRTFEIKRDLADLVAQASGLLRDGGTMLIATNNRSLSVNWLVQQVEKACSRTWRIAARPVLPVDFAPDPAYQKTIVVRFS